MKVSKSSLTINHVHFLVTIGLISDRADKLQYIGLCSLFLIKFMISIDSITIFVWVKMRLWRIDLKNEGGPHHDPGQSIKHISLYLCITYFILSLLVYNTCIINNIKIWRCLYLSRKPMKEKKNLAFPCQANPSQRFCMKAIDY